MMLNQVYYNQVIFAGQPNKNQFFIQRQIDLQKIAQNEIEKAPAISQITAMFHQRQNSYHQKRQRKHDQLRKQAINQLFSDKRKHLQKQRLLEFKIVSRQRFHQLIEQYERNQLSNRDSLLNDIHKQLQNENQDVKQLIRIYGSNLLNIWIAMPKKSLAIQIFHMIVRQSDAYQSLFKQDDQEFLAIYKEKWLDIKIPRQQMTQCQLSLCILFETINTEIYLLDDLQPTPQSMSLQQFNKAKEYNRLIEKRLRLYFDCFNHFCSTRNLFIYREEFCQKYAKKWLKYLVLQKNWQNSGFLSYLMMLSIYHIPLETMSKKGYESLNHENYSHKQLVEADEKIIDKLFSWGIPSNGQTSVNVNRIPMTCMVALKLLFQNQQTSVYYIIKYSSYILHFTRLVLNYQTYFKQSKVIQQYDLVGNILERLIRQYQQQDQPLRFYQQLRSLGIYQEMKQMNFFNCLDVSLKCSSNKIRIVIYRLLQKLIGYCIEYDLSLKQLFHQNDLFLLIIKGIDEEYPQIILESLNCIESLCSYANNVSKDDQYLINMINLGVDQTIDNLMHHKNQQISLKAQLIADNYFDKDKTDRYKQQHAQNSRDQNDNNILAQENVYNPYWTGIQVPPRDEIYE